MKFDGRIEPIVSHAFITKPKSREQASLFDNLGRNRSMFDIRTMEFWLLSTILKKSWNLFQLKKSEKKISQRKSSEYACISQLGHSDLSHSHGVGQEGETGDGKRKKRVLFSSLDTSYFQYYILTFRHFLSLWHLFHRPCSSDQFLFLSFSCSFP